MIPIGCAHDSGEKINVLIVSICLPIGVGFTLRSNAHRAVIVCVLLLQDLLQSCARGGRRRVEDMCYERRRAEACVDESAHHALVNAGGREIV
jgi:hypothetical protein